MASHTKLDGRPSECSPGTTQRACTSSSILSPNTRDRVAVPPGRPGTEPCFRSYAASRVSHGVPRTMRASALRWSDDSHRTAPDEGETMPTERVPNPATLIPEAMQTLIAVNKFILGARSGRQAAGADPPARQSDQRLQPLCGRRRPAGPPQRRHRETGRHRRRMA
jgi:hypothetical protein